MLYSGKRFLIEFLRGDNPRVILGLTLSQALSAAVFIVSLFIFIRLRPRRNTVK
jgi:prolipoprotein diacylglyceryltransferase